MLPKKLLHGDWHMLMEEESAVLTRQKQLNGLFSLGAEKSQWAKLIVN